MTTCTEIVELRRKKRQVTPANDVPMSGQRMLTIYAITEDGVPLLTDYCDPEVSMNLVMIQLEDGYAGRYFLISPTYPFGSILNTYAGMEGQPRSLLEFVYNGNIVNEHDTFFSLQMDYGARVKVMCKTETRK
ncbi:hypothetical protein QR680_001224 [Steinernema hermaphroditum]|uniref:Uncharacterized protein n=1 Tax=Steinernema hermaphroditum TaxID=289476 RepID=A0AA39LFM6_9BILA|nr:hypothetical protein QR680_001224 [Steinernema hermaphroditum]